MTDILNRDLWTAQEAAEQVGVDVDTIYQWVRRGYLQHAGTRGRHKLFDLEAVYAAEKTRERRHRRKRAA
jgi:excisionase family DNA binding protein